MNRTSKADCSKYHNCFFFKIFETVSSGTWQVALANHVHVSGIAPRASFALRRSQRYFCYRVLSFVVVSLFLPPSL